MNDNGQTINPDTELIAVGRIRRPFGLRGQCYIDSYGQTVASFRLPVTVLLGMDTATTAPEVVTFLKSTPKGYLCGFAGYDSIEQVELLRSRYIFVTRDRIPPLKKNQYFMFELQGMKVITVPDNETIGVVKEVESFPTVDALNVMSTNGTSIFICIKDEIIEKVDKNTKCITVYRAAIEQLLER